MKISVIGGGSWGTTLAQVLEDNGHETLVYDINKEGVDKINKGIHPFFDLPIEKIKATTSLEETLNFSDHLVLAVPTKFMRQSLSDINKLSFRKNYFINVSKGIEPNTLKRVSEIVKDEISKEFLGAYAVLTGPSHAEEVILRKLTVLTAASETSWFAQTVQKLFSNRTYLRIYTSDDLIGCEVGGAIKNAIAIVSGIMTGFGLGENARAALITRGILEIVRVVSAMGGKKETAFGLTGIGDLIVTASSNNSRNFNAGLKIGQGIPVDQVLAESRMVVEGVRAIQAAKDLCIKEGIELPIIEVAYDVIFNQLPVKDAITLLLTRELKAETLE
ncbi:NAD(P)-dependent glycerol-3-phosphate dehydrogenase [Acholeplasma equirhinis]|uniref:NAD(P)H-dependent glycerol-3-phosphate dehydrogenase n=1 Tax=Acholeplasma equirhinis TaxID=555393 RepID=UPI00197AE1C2|nr:NAD(P)H-dependent glycerol-3-phosphate dehydrogenase [Acholeplasma equirhinis]MBN3490560.1 NAD(P)-dependent glycerol-3-phosphate dehydrogenase [Acholeplasma equirhinis]